MLSYFPFTRPKPSDFGMTALSHLRSLTNFSMGMNELSPMSVAKVQSTVLYSMNNRTSQNADQVTRRCAIATMAEQKVAEHMNGFVMNCDIDFNDPFTYAFDVLSGIDFYGARIEVKTHQSNSRWISVNLDERNSTGHMNLFHFLNFDVSDYITIFNSSQYADNGYNFSCAFVGTKHELQRVIRKSNYNGWYLHI